MKKLTSLLLAIIFLLSATPVFAESETPTTGSGTEDSPWVVYSWSALKEKMVLGGCIKLGEDVVDSETGAITVPGGTEVTLDLNGFTVNRNLNQAKYYGYVILVNGELDITDSGETGKITGGNCRYRNGYTYGGGICINGGTCNLYGGSVCKNNSEGSGGICVMNTGTLNVYGGSISNNTTSSSGCGIGSYDSTVNIHGGVISKNSCEGYGGGIYLDNSVLTMDNGLINGNHAYWGGGVCLSYGSSFVFNDGTISENNSGNTGGAVTCMEGSTATFTMNGGIISGNYSKNGNKGGGVYVCNNFKFYLNGGRITGNYVEYSNNNYTLELGGGVAVWGTGFYVKGSPVIKDNYCLNTATGVSTANDVDVQPAYGNWNINLTGALEDGASIGVSAHDTGQVTSGFKTYHENDEPAKFFFCDQEGYKVYKNANGEAAIKSVPKHTVSFNPNGGTIGDNWLASQSVFEDAELSVLLGDTVPQSPDKSTVKAPKGKYFDGYDITVGDNDTVTLMPGSAVNVSITDETSVKYRWANPTLTMHFSSPDGVDLMEPIVLTGDVGDTVENIINNNYGEDAYRTVTIFPKDGYREIQMFTSKPMTEYDSILALSVDSSVVRNTKITGDGLEIYRPMFKVLPAVPNVEIAAPLCKTVTTTQKDNYNNWDWENQTNQPNISLPENSHCRAMANWATKSEYDVNGEPFIGTLEGDKSYYVMVTVATNYGYAFPKTETPLIINGEPSYSGLVAEAGAMGVTKVTAIHDFGDNEKVCKRCGAANPDYKEPAPAPTPTPAPTPAPIPTPAPVLTPEEAAMQTEEKAEQAIKKTNTDKNDVAGAEYQRLMLKATSKKKTVTLKWKKVKGASGYIIYGAPCGQNMTRLATVTNPKTVKKTFKKLKKGKYYKYIVVAYKKTVAGNRIMSKSKSVHCATPGGKKGNPTGIKIKKSKLNLKKGKKAKIKATLKTKGKVATHIAKFRYESSNKKIATVDKKGNIKAKKKGSVKIYVYTQNGISKTVKVKIR